MIELSFRKDYLKDLYEGKKVTDKRFKSNPQLVRQYVKTVGKLKSIEKIEQLYQIASLNYEALSGDRAGHSSVKINDQFRLIFEEIRSEEEPFEVVLLELEEISNHYA